MSRKLQLRLGIAIFTLCGPLSLAGPNDSKLTEREQVLQDQQKNRQEVLNSETSPNSKSTPTKLDISNLKFDENARFEITNHLLGYSLLMDQDYSYDGIKITGFLNVAYYSPRKNNDGERKRGRLVFGVEEPVAEISGRSSVFLGGGLTMGDAFGLYGDVGLDFYLLSWCKAQIGANYTTGSGHVSPQASLGLTW